MLNYFRQNNLFTEHQSGLIPGGFCDVVAEAPTTINYP